MNKKGFTLIEIIICLSLIIFIGTISIISLKNANQGFNEQDLIVLQNAIDIATMKLESTNQLKKYVENKTEDDGENITSFFCLKKETLIDMGVISSVHEVLKKMGTDQYIKVLQDDVGFNIYDQPVSPGECEYLKSEINNSTVENTEPVEINNLNFSENGYYL